MAQPLDITGNKFGKLTAIRKSDIQLGKGVIWDCKCDCGNTISYPVNYLKAGRRKSCGCLASGERIERPAPKIMYRFWDKFLRLANRRNLAVTITAEYVQFIYEEQKGICKFSGIPISLPSNQEEARSGNYTASIDRIDSSKGYIEGNIQWVHKKINIMKQNMSDEEFVEWCDIISLFRRSY